MTFMIETVTFALLLAAFAMAIPVSFITLQIGAALLPARRSTFVAPSPSPSVAVVMPAHNEEEVISDAVSSILSQLSPDGRLLVVADNCDDNTARIALRAGAAVTIRHDKTRIGKGYALDHGIRILSADPPHVVIFVDADCKVEPGSLKTLATRCASTGRPVQACYGMLAPPLAGPADKASQLAWTIKTLVRPLGSANLGLPCQLMGSGMALPFAMIGKLHLATGHLAEDQKLGAELALAGKPPQFVPEAQVLSRLPQAEPAKRQQRIRWEHGHLAIIEEFSLPLIASAISKRNLQLFAFTMDLCVPPLSLLALLLALIEFITLSWFAVTNSIGPLLISSAVLVLLVASISVAWWRFARDILPLGELTAIPTYCLSRIPSAIRFFVNRQMEWVRTER